MQVTWLDNKMGLIWVSAQPTQYQGCSLRKTLGIRIVGLEKLLVEEARKP